MASNCDFDLRLMNLKAQAEGCEFDPFETCKPKSEDFFKLEPGCLPFGVSCGWSASVCTVEGATFEACLWFPSPVSKDLSGTPISADDLENLANFLEVVCRMEDPNDAQWLGQSVTIQDATIRVNREFDGSKAWVVLFLEYNEAAGGIAYFLTDKQATLLSSGCRTAATLFRQYERTEGNFNA